MSGLEIEGGERSLAEIASAYFIRASMQCPASSSAQGACIALESLESGHNPTSLREALLADPEMLRGIQKAAIAKHTEDQNVTLERVVQFINQGFESAQDYITARLTPEQLRLIRDFIYPKRSAQVRQEPRMGFLNAMVKIDVEELIRRGALRPWRESNPQPGA